MQGGSDMSRPLTAAAGHLQITGHAVDLRITKGGDGEFYALFVDMLGFSALVEAHPHSVVHTLHPTGRGSTTTPSGEVFNRFHHHLDVLAEAPTDTGPNHVMIFSDSAFFMYQNAHLATDAAQRLMCWLILAGIPARMGLGFGTCGLHRFTYDSLPSLTVARAMFSGTAVVRAHAAEKCGGKGCRVFVHPSFLGNDQSNKADLIDLPHPCESATSELNYLPNEPTAHDALWLRLQDTHRAAPMEARIQQQYLDTFDALQRMRSARGLQPLRDPDMP
jgi:hypothetical protein